MRIFVKTKSALATFALDMEASDSIADVKAKIQKKEGIPANRRELYCLQDTASALDVVLQGADPYQQHQVLAGEPLEDGQTLLGCNIANNSTLFLMFKRLPK